MQKTKEALKTQNSLHLLLHLQTKSWHLCMDLLPAKNHNTHHSSTQISSSKLIALWMDSIIQN
jgi:hypothetical protein